MAEMTCNGDCMACNAAQRIYCAAQNCHVILENQRLILSQLQELRASLSQSEIVNPLSDATSTGEAGAENRASTKRRTSKKVKENEL